MPKANIQKKIEQLDNHSLEVIVHSVKLMGVRLLGMSIAFCVSILLGRTLGAQGLGIISLAEQITNLLLTVALFGMPTVVLKEVAIAYNQNNSQHTANNMYSALRFTGYFALFLVFVFVLLSSLLSDVFGIQGLQTPLVILLLTIIPMVFSRIYGSGLVAYKKGWLAILLEQALSIGVVAILLLISHFIFDVEITAVLTAIFYAIGRLCSLGALKFFWALTFVFKGTREKITRNLTNVARPLLWASICDVVYACSGILILGWLRTPTEVGIFAVADKLALLTCLFLTITNTSVAPKIASLYAANNKCAMRIMVKRINVILMVIGILSLLFFLTLGKWILSLWGGEFVAGYWVLIILAAGQFVNLSTGAVGFLLTMTGHEKINGQISLLYMVVNIPLCVICVFYWGMLGAAIATSLTVAASNLTRLYYIKEKQVMS